MKLQYIVYCSSNAYGRGCTSICEKGLAGHKCNAGRCIPGTENISLY